MNAKTLKKLKRRQQLLAELELEREHAVQAVEAAAREP